MRSALPTLHPDSIVIPNNRASLKSSSDSDDTSSFEDSDDNANIRNDSSSMSEYEINSQHQEEDKNSDDEGTNTDTRRNIVVKCPDGQLMIATESNDQETVSYFDKS